MHCDRALESAGGMPPRKGRRRKDPTPTAATRPSAAEHTAPDDLADPSGEPLPDGDDVVDGDPDVDGGAVRTTSGGLPSRSAATASASGASQIGDDGSSDDDAHSGRRGDQSMIAEARLPVSLEQQRRRRQWAFGGTAAVAVVACALLIKGLSGSSGGSDNASLPDITVRTAPGSVATQITSAATATSSGAPRPPSARRSIRSPSTLPTVRNAPAQYGFYLDGDIVLQGTVPSKSKGAEMKLAAGDLVGNDHVKAGVHGQVVGSNRPPSAALHRQPDPLRQVRQPRPRVGSSGEGRRRPDDRRSPGTHGGARLHQHEGLAVRQPRVVEAAGRCRRGRARPPRRAPRTTLRPGSRLDRSDGRQHDHEGAARPTTGSSWWARASSADQDGRAAAPASPSPAGTSSTPPRRGRGRTRRRPRGSRE